jgi:hypothetical protein
LLANLIITSQTGLRNAKWLYLYRAFAFIVCYTFLGILIKAGERVVNYIQEYYRLACEAFRRSNTESNFTPLIIALLEKFGCRAVDTSGERSRQEGENIDIKIWRGDDNTTETEPFAGVEIKKVGGIDARAKAQVKKEASLFGHAILTDNLVWEFWRAGEDKMYGGVRLMELIEGKLELKTENIELFTSLIQDFLLQDPAQIRSSNKLAEYMAIHAKTIRSVITGILKENSEGLPILDDRQKRLPLFPELYGLFTRIKADLRPLLNTRSFADMYAQTIVYGLFIARHNDVTSKTFNRYEAISKLQEESALLNRFFEHITSTGSKHPTLDVVIDKLCALYQTCNISELLDDKKHGDTIIHFYENFLTYYDPALRKSLGVFYTPHQVVRYLVSMVDKLLVEDFGIVGGLSNNDQIQIEVPCERYEYQKAKGAKKEWRDTKDVTVPRVAILDPSTGTGTFHAEIIKYIKTTYFSGVRSAFYDDYIKNENGLLSRMIGFEIMMTSYAIAHLNVRRTIEETLGYIPDVQLPTNIFLTNTLAAPNSSFERHEQMSLFDFSAAITDEAYKADTWKARRPIKVIIGNPPYLAASTNPFDISMYKTETDGVTDFGERKHWLNDDYVKFFCFAEQIINKNNNGILAFVSNNGFLDNSTFRGMRASLLRTFEKIYIVNLHGNAIKKEVAPDGSKDENIFDIMQGVSLFIGMKKSLKCEWAKIYYTNLWGLRADKFNRLLTSSLDFIELTPDLQMAYFLPFNNSAKVSYEKGISVVELFPSYVTGILTGNDKAAVAPKREELNRRLEIVKNAIDEKPILELWGKFGSGQSADKIKQDALSPTGIIAPMSYRPFDERWTYYSGNSCGWVFRPREKKIMGHLLNANESPIGCNIGLVFAKQTSQRFEWDGVFISDKLIEVHYIDYPAKSTGYVAPLYLKPEGFGTEWSPNINVEHFNRLTKYLHIKPSPIETFDYIYAILFDPVYRVHFGEYLSRDFPRVPIINAPQESEGDFVVTEEMFRAYVTAGESLRKLHLMQIKTPASIEIDPPTATDLKIGAIKYKSGILHINLNKRITGIPEDVWNYRIGGYQVLDKWFKSRKGMTLNIEDFDHIANVVGLLAETIKIQANLKTLHM